MLSMTITIMSYLDHLYFDSSPNDGGYTEYKVEKRVFKRAGQLYLQLLVQNIETILS